MHSDRGLGCQGVRTETRESSRASGQQCLPSWFWWLQAGACVRAGHFKCVDFHVLCLHHGRVEQNLNKEFDLANSFYLRNFKTSMLSFYGEKKNWLAFVRIEPSHGQNSNPQASQPSDPGLQLLACEGVDNCESWGKHTSRTQHHSIPASETCLGRHPASEGNQNVSL